MWVPADRLPLSYLSARCPLFPHLSPLSLAHRTPAVRPQVKTVLALAREMLAALDSLPYPDTLGKMQIRIGVHVGTIHGGVIGVKYPRYSLFGGTLRLVQGLQVGAGVVLQVWGYAWNARNRVGDGSGVCLAAGLLGEAGCLLRMWEEPKKRGGAGPSGGGQRLQCGDAV